MSKAAGEILQFCKNPRLRAKVDQIMVHAQPNENEKKEINRFFDSHVLDLYKNALEYSVLRSDYDLHEDEVAELENQFNSQLNYWWLEIQSEWIRCNNLLNYKMAIKNERDPVLLAKASICTFFLSPVAKFLDLEELEININFLKSLIERSQYQGLFDDINQESPTIGPQSKSETQA